MVGKEGKRRKSDKGYTKTRLTERCTKHTAIKGLKGAVSGLRIHLLVLALPSNRFTILATAETQFDKYNSSKKFQ